MSSFMIAFLVSLGSGAWIYSKLMNSTGGDTKTAVSGAVASGIALLIVLWILLKMFAK